MLTIERTQNIQTETAEYAAAVEARVRVIAAEHGVRLRGPVTMAQIGLLARQLHVNPADWFPLLAAAPQSFAPAHVG